MSLFGDMFTEAGESVDAGAPSGPIPLDLGNVPTPPRAAHGLCGIYNQGATCYLNSLLQSLMLTPEFREALFNLGPELGQLEDKDNTGSKVRVIPLQLQWLFAELLLLDQLAASTTPLTDSFGWSNSEELQQHDVQELNRILFSAIEDSLVATSGQGLIQRLYHGQTVSQIICEECGHISEREEDFLDVCVAVSGNSSLEEALSHNYIAMETMEGSNQYRCERCQKLVNAKKGAKIRRLPPVLTISLLRFSFDFEKMERYKETGKCTFPEQLDMAPFCENPSVLADTEYELFSVVIHRGSTHGGHYHAYIRDVDNLGRWTDPDEEDIVVTSDPQSGKVDLIEVDNPQELLEVLLLQHREGGMAVDKLCAEMTKQTGVSWNKRFKKSYGPVNKFLKKYSHQFKYTQETNWVELADVMATRRDHLQRPRVKSQDDQESTEAQVGISKNRHRKRSPSPPPKPGYSWYDFDDSRIRPIRKKDIESQFSGKESAYMLFYRRKAMERQQEAQGNVLYGVPSAMVGSILHRNDQLAIARQAYEEKINHLELAIHFGLCYEFCGGALHPKPDTLQFMHLVIDRRQSVGELKTAIKELGGVLCVEPLVLHIAQDLPAGLHLYACLDEEDAQPIMLTPVANHAKLFVWDGKQVGGMEINLGKEWEPIKLTFLYHHGEGLQFARGFPRCMTFNDVKVIVSNNIQMPPADLVFSRVHTDGVDSTVTQMTQGQDTLTLDELKVKEGNHFIVEKQADSEILTCDNMPVQYSNQMTFVVENRCEAAQDGHWKLFPVTVNNDVSVGELKAQILSQLDLNFVKDGGRIRADDDDLGLRPPLHEEQSLNTAGLKLGQRLVVEPGPAPQSDQMTLSVSYAGCQRPLELIIAGSATVGHCLISALSLAGLPERGYHLCMTNWWGEAGSILDDLSATLLDCHLRDGEHMLLQPGELPPKGFLKLAVYLYVCGDESAILSDALQGVRLQCDPAHTASCPKDMVFLGEVVISKKATLADLTEHILSLPSMGAVAIEALSCLRIRVLENGRPRTVLRGISQSLPRLKVVAGMKLVVQVLRTEEELNSSQILLNLCQRVVQSQSYFPPEEFVWDFSKGCGASHLKAAIAQHMGLPTSQIVIAKHFPEKCAWMVLEDTLHRKPTKQVKNKKKGQAKMNLKQAPYHLADGDDIGVKDVTYDSSGSDDFCTLEDRQGLQRMLREIEEKKRTREEMKQRNAAFGFGVGDVAKQRPEVGIKIHVGDFR